MTSIIRGDFTPEDQMLHKIKHTFGLDSKSKFTNIHFEEPFKPVKMEQTQRKKISSSELFDMKLYNRKKEIGLLRNPSTIEMVEWLVIDGYQKANRKIKT